MLRTAYGNSSHIDNIWCLPFIHCFEAYSILQTYSISSGLFAYSISNYPPSSYYFVLFLNEFNMSQYVNFAFFRLPHLFPLNHLIYSNSCNPWVLSQAYSTSQYVNMSLYVRNNICWLVGGTCQSNELLSCSLPFKHHLNVPPPH